MAGETEPEVVENDDAFNAGFEDDGQTTTPDPDFDGTGEPKAEETQVETPPEPRYAQITLSLIHISEPTRRHHVSRMPSSA